VTCESIVLHYACGVEVRVRHGACVRVFNTTSGSNHVQVRARVRHGECVCSTLLREVGNTRFIFCGEELLQNHDSKIP
jgi:hypothetical protein